MLRRINKNYNPLGEKATFLVDEFLKWSEKEGEFYWLWGSAVELANEKTNPKNIIKELPFSEQESDYKDLLIDAWLRFFNSDDRLSTTLWKEYKTILAHDWQNDI